MILLDTNVISTIMAPSPTSQVTEWLNRQESSLLYLSTITLAEIGYGLWVLPDGKKRRDLENRFDAYLEVAFESRILDFDRKAAKEYAEVMGHRRKIGKPLGVADGQIASIARAHRFAVATRNVRDFEDCGLELLNPFEVS
ncbi:MAG: type II toxin-antitoxin system VapC family toxin [Acidobacteria bacterium]|nr:type II toxin-antitoxin system VapC family toxin [Acidobacteriota bacterium]